MWWWRGSLRGCALAGVCAGGSGNLREKSNFHQKIPVPLEIFNGDLVESNTQQKKLAQSSSLSQLKILSHGQDFSE